jgi:hypothetical protein
MLNDNETQTTSYGIGRVVHTNAEVRIWQINKKLSFKSGFARAAGPSSKAVAMKAVLDGNGDAYVRLVLLKQI